MSVSDYIEQGAVKVVEIIGISTESFEDAVGRAVAKASETIRGITGVEVVRMSARVDDGAIVQYKADCRLAFPVK